MLGQTESGFVCGRFPHFYRFSLDSNSERQSRIGCPFRWGNSHWRLQSVRCNGQYIVCIAMRQCKSGQTIWHERPEAELAGQTIVELYEYVN